MSRGMRVCRFPVLALLPVLTGLALLDPRQAQTKAEKHALIVGVRDYNSAKFPRLKYTENDANELARVLEQTAGFTVRVLTTLARREEQGRRPHGGEPSRRDQDAVGPDAARRQLVRCIATGRRGPPGCWPCWARRPRRRLRSRSARAGPRSGRSGGG